MQSFQKPNDSESNIQLRYLLSLQSTSLDDQQLVFQAAKEEGRSKSNGYALFLCYLFCSGRFHTFFRDDSRAFSYAEASVKTGNIFGTNSVAYCYNTGLGVKHDVSKALDLFQKASQKGNASAMNNSAIAYEDGTGIPKDMNKAIELYNRAIELGNYDAAANLGLCYQHGKGLPRNREKAIELFTKASMKGSLQGTLYLADCFKSRKGIKESNAKKVIDLLKKAQSLGCKSWMSRKELESLVSQYPRIAEQLCFDKEVLLLLLCCRQFVTQSLFYEGYLPFEIFEMIIQQADIAFVLPPRNKQIKHHVL